MDKTQRPILVLAEDDQAASSCVLSGYQPRNCTSVLLDNKECVSPVDITRR